MGGFRIRIARALDMELRAFYGSVTVSLSLPRFFPGSFLWPIIIHTGDDNIRFSPALGERAHVTHVALESFTGRRPDMMPCW